MYELEIKDKYGQMLQEHDVVIGHLGWVGRKKKGYPDSVRTLLRIHWNPYEAQYQLRPIGIVFEDYSYFINCNNYREIQYELRVDPKRMYGDLGCSIGGTRRQDMKALSLEKVNINNYKYYVHFLADKLYTAREKMLSNDILILKQVNDKTGELISWFDVLIDRIKSENIEKLMISHED